MSKENTSNEMKYDEESFEEQLKDFGQVSSKIYNPNDEVSGKFVHASDLFIEPQCSICTCPFRLEADQKYLDSIDPKTNKGTYAIIQKFLAQKGIDVFWTSCKIHAISHIRTKYSDDLPVVYGDKLLDMQHELKGCESQVDTAIAALFERLYKLGSYTDTNSLVKEIEITKGMTAVVDKLSKLWDLKNNALQTTSEETMRQRLVAILTNILSKLPEEYHEVIRDEIKKLKF